MLVVTTGELPGCNNNNNSNNNNSNLQAFQLIVLARHLLGAPEP